MKVQVHNGTRVINLRVGEQVTSYQLHKGVHEIPKEHEEVMKDNWFFKNLEESGDISIVSDKAKSKPAQTLDDKLTPQQKAARAASQARAKKALEAAKQGENKGQQ